VRADGKFFEIAKQFFWVYRVNWAKVWALVWRDKWLRTYKTEKEKKRV
jgi:hypothetical protein